MEVTYYGAGCVLVSTKQLKILIDPVSGEYGPNPKLSADVVLFTQQPTQEIASGAKTHIDSPGEYEIKSVTIEGVAARLHTEAEAGVENGVMYSISYNDLRVITTGNVYPDISNEQTERLDGADVLVVPVGGNGLTLDKEAAASLVRQFDPSYVVGVHFDDGATDYPLAQAPISDFLAEVGATEIEPQESLKISAREGHEETIFVHLNPTKLKK